MPESANFPLPRTTGVLARRNARLRCRCCHTPLNDCRTTIRWIDPASGLIFVERNTIYINVFFTGDTLPFASIDVRDGGEVPLIDTSDREAFVARCRRWLDEHDANARRAMAAAEFGTRVPARRPA